MSKGENQNRQILPFEEPIAEFEKKLSELRNISSDKMDLTQEIKHLETKVEKLRKETFGKLSAIQKVQISRHSGRPYSMDYIDLLMDDFVELHGDRFFLDDAAIIAGLASFEGHNVLVIGHQKGRGTKENMQRNFGMPQPDGYRKAARLMELASRFHRPILSFIDTPGAFPGIEAEERGQSVAIAKSLQTMAGIRSPFISTVIGEGGSGGALAIGAANRILMLEYSSYSVISPEGCASILWRDQTQSPEAAMQLKLTAPDLLRLGICDEVVSEAPGGAHRDFVQTANNLRIVLRRHLEELMELEPEELIQDRYDKFRRIGNLVENNTSKFLR